MESDVASYDSSTYIETRNAGYNSQHEMVQLSVQVMANSQYYQMQKPPIPKKPKRIAPQPSTFHIGSGGMRKHAEYET